jgi:N6-L-threonylcarbamoyladenine synthase
MEDPDSPDGLSDSILMHLSGGTTEFLLCRPDEAGYDTSIAGGSLDISFGQHIDRIGVAMGLPFPSGAYLDKQAAGYTGNTADHIKLPAVKIQEGYFNLSGIETSIMRSLPDMDESARNALPSAVLGLIAGILLRSADELSARCGSGTVWMSGGVASSEYIRSIIERQKGSADIRFGKPSLSGDNAVGIARLAHRLQENK